MLTIDESTYPIVLVQIENTATLEDTEQYLSRFTDWLSHEHPFGIIVHESNTDDVETAQAKDSHRLTVQWARQNKSKIAQFCVGMVLVIDTPEILENRRSIISKGIETIFGCPGQAFATQVEARLWLQQQSNENC